MLQEAVALLFSKQCVQSRVKMSIYVPCKISMYWYTKYISVSSTLYFRIICKLVLDKLYTGHC